MKRLLIASLILLTIETASSISYASDFSPTLLKISADQRIYYDFDGSTLEIPVTVSGTDAGVILSIFTKDMAEDISQIQNGYLGWHYVNKADICIYYSPLQHMQMGDNVITWDGKDLDGDCLSASSFTYYLWAFDNKNQKQTVSRQLGIDTDFGKKTVIQEVDESGMPLTNPILFNIRKSVIDSKAHLDCWVLGNDPDDNSMLMTIDLTAPIGWDFHGVPLPAPDDHNYFYFSVANADAKQAAIQKYKLIEGGSAEMVPDWGGEAPYSEIYSTRGGSTAGVATDGTYLFTTDSNIYNSDEPDADFYIYDMDGYLVEEVDLTPWWSSASGFESGGQMNGGPDSFASRDGYVFLNSHASCLNQMIDPARYLETGEFEDLFVWSNGNGDYVLDKNFEETSQRPWVCNDFEAGLYKYSISSDDKLFSAVSAYDAGAASFGLFAPDGKGLGYFAYAGETAGHKYATFFVDSETPFDGIYASHVGTGGPSDHGPPEADLTFIGHDSIKGIIHTHDGGHYNIVNLSLYYPRYGETFVAGETCIIRWQEKLIGQVDISVSYDGGENWSPIASGIDANLGEYSWVIPDVSSGKCRIKISDSSNENRKSSNYWPFSIGSGLSLIEPDAGEEFGIMMPYTIQWTSYGIDKINIYFSSNGGDTWELVADKVSAGQGSFDWQFPEDAHSECRFKIENTYNSDQYSYSDQFRLIDTFIILTSPAQTAELYSRQTVNIEWKSNNVETVNIDVKFDDGDSWVRIHENARSSEGSFEWLIPVIEGSQCRIRISDVGNPDINDISDTYLLLR